MKESPHSSSLRSHRLSDRPETFFVTKSLHPKKPVLNKETRDIVVSAFAFAVEQKRIYLRAFVVMPDHWHALFALTEDWTLPKFIHHMMSFVGARTVEHLQASRTHWQEGYYDTLVKTARQFEFVAYYIEQNPVANGLVQQPDHWDASSVAR
ncbi:MAG TPA: transposase, partial [Chthoniobacterales bacterium]|nr:transposase [Chthoniobacterales bacterium]